jgi:hypothetical protein
MSSAICGESLTVEDTFAATLPKGSNISISEAGFPVNSLDLTVDCEMLEVTKINVVRTKR